MYVFSALQSVYIILPSTVHLHIIHNSLSLSPDKLFRFAFFILHASFIFLICGRGTRLLLVLKHAHACTCMQL